MTRGAGLLLLVVSCFVGYACAQRGATSDIELRVKVTYDNDQPVNLPLRVQLLNGTSNTISDSFTDSTGQAVFRSIRGGNYRIRVSGNGVIDTTSEMFTVDPRDRFQMQYVHVTREHEEGTSQRGAAAVSAAELNIPDRARKEFDKGRDAMAKNSWEDAAKHFHKAADLYPRYALALNNLGVIAINQKDESSARLYFEQAIAADDHLASAYLNLGKLDYNEHKLKEAQAPLIKTLSIDPANVEALLLMAATELATGGVNDAIVYARKIHALPHEKYAISHIIAAQALEQNHQNEQAISEYQLYLKEAPQSNMAKKAQDAVTRLERRR